MGNDLGGPVVCINPPKPWQRIKPLYILVLFILLLIASAAFFYQKFLVSDKKLPAGKDQPKNLVVLKEGPLPSPNEKQKGSFICPGISSFCKNGKDIFSGSSYIGFGNKLSKNSPIYAAFDGYFEATQAAIANPSGKAKSQDIITGILTDKGNLLRAHYYFTGSFPKNRNVFVKAGDIIAYSGQAMPLYQDSTLVFVLTRNDRIMGKRLGGERVRLTSRDFK